MKKLICIALLFVCGSINSQNVNELWKKSDSENISSNKMKLDFPLKNILSLDFKLMKRILSNAPKRNFTKQNSNVFITLPNNDGVLEQYYVYENTVLSPELAAKFPEIQSYIAVNVQDVNTIAYFSLSPLGFKSMILNSNKETIFIEPINKSFTNYTVFKTTDRKQAFTKFECVVDQTVLEFNNEFTSNNERGADDAKLRTYKLAVSCTGEYASYFGGTKVNALAAINNTITRVNGIFERDFGVRFQLVANNDLVLFTDASTDPYSTSTYFGNQLQTTLNTNIGDANFDLGHLFDISNAGGASGGIGSIGITNSKGKAYSSKSNPVGDLFDIQFVAHEMAHQLGAKHTFSYITESSNIAQLEPGSGSTIMSYAGKTGSDIQSHYDTYFHAITIQQVTDKIKTLTCGVVTSTGNAVPVVNAGLDYTIPKSTPFMLNGNASDSNDSDQLTYSWEEMDLGNSANSCPASSNVSGPLFRSYSPSTNSVRYFPNMNSILNGLNYTQGSVIVSETLPNVARTLNFRLTVRDNKVSGAANNADDMVVTVSDLAGPFIITSQNTTTSYEGGSTQAITWSVAGTDSNAVNCSFVDILLSTDGGLTFPITLLTATPNDGLQNVVIPNLPGVTNRIMVKGSNHIFFDVNNVNFTITGNAIADLTAPTVSVISASGTTATSTNLSWTASTDNIAVAGYKVYQNGVLKTTTATTSLLVTNLVASTTYSFYVTAFDAAGNVSNTSNVVSVQTQAHVDTTAPTASVISASGTTTTSTNLTWTTATDNITVAGYKVYQNGVLKTTTTTTSLLVTNLVASTTYSFYVTAFDAAGNVSNSSNVVSVQTQTPVDVTAPTASIISASGTTTTSTNLSWTAATDNIAVAGYKVYQNGTLKATTTTTSLAITGLVAATTYSFYVTAFDAAGNSSILSNTLYVTTMAPSVTYCTSYGNTTREFINRVQIGTINNLSGNNNGYGNYTSLSTTISAGVASTIIITPAWNGAATSEAYSVWIDYNRDGVFGSNELVFSKAKTRATSVSGSFVVPTTALTGNTRMRVSMKYNVNPTACEIFTNGEVEDYTVTISNGTLVRVVSEQTIAKNTDVEVGFNVYPNPVKGDVIYFSGVQNNTDYMIFNQMGQQVAAGVISSDSINVGHLVAGIYFIQLKNNSVVGTKRFVKE